MFSLNPHSGIPVYRQLIDQVRRLVAGGQLRPGDALPSVRELALTHALNPMTISKAYSLLEAEGLLERQRGKPMTVAEQPHRRESKTERLQRLQPVVEQLATAARQLQLSPTDVLGAVRRALENEHD
jgi:GntR family transcriptional regulator